MTELVASYSLGIGALIVLAIAMVIKSMISGTFKGAIAREPVGQPPQGDIDLHTFRIVRAHMNGVENVSPLFAAGLLAMMVGANASWVNGLLVAAVLLRVLYWPVYVWRISRSFPPPSLRTNLYLLGLVINLVLAGFALYALMT